MLRNLRWGDYQKGLLLQRRARAERLPNQAKETPPLPLKSRRKDKGGANDALSKWQRRAFGETIFRASS